MLNDAVFLAHLNFVVVDRSLGLSSRDIPTLHSLLDCQSRLLRCCKMLTRFPNGSRRKDGILNNLKFRSHSLGSWCCNASQGTYQDMYVERSQNHDLLL